jgi:uncharacterized membrane protein
MDAQQRLSADRKADVQWQNANAEECTGRPAMSSEAESQSQAHSRSSSRAARRWTVIASGLLLLALALVVIYTDPSAFFSPVALVVVSAIGLAALLLQVRFRQDLPNIHSPLWLNVLGIICAMASLFADNLRMKGSMLDVVAFGAVVCFGISGSLILHALRKRVRTPQPNAAE